MLTVFESPDVLPAASVQYAVQVVVTPRATLAKLVDQLPPLQVASSSKPPSVELRHSTVTVTQSDASQVPARSTVSVLR